jgi:polyisoprenoid-binding protein YceI
MLKRLLTIGLLMGSGIAVASGKCEFAGSASIGVLEFTGTGCIIEGKPAIAAGKVTGEFTADLTKLDAGVRSEHMHEKYLETKKFPKAVLKLDPMPEAGGPFTGKLTLHGVEKPIEGVANKSSIGWSFAIKLNTKDFGITQASYKGITVAETIILTGSIDR